MHKSSRLTRETNNLRAENAELRAGWRRSIAG